MSFNFILLYSITIFVASIIPGPSMLLALTHGMQYGVRKTVSSALGNVAVTVLQASVSIAGLGTILIASETIFHVIKWAGAAYLIFMGIRIFCSSNMTFSSGNSGFSAKSNSARKMFLQAAFVTAGNPKAIVFFTAIFPQFIDPDSAYLSQSFILLSVGSLIAFVCFMLYAVGGQKIISLFSETNIARFINKIIGGTFVGAGIGLAASNR
jgi:homoserine/homoserine lactone efflux protein